MEARAERKTLALAEKQGSLALENGHEIVPSPKK
jgi:hypothetical protein